MLCKEDKQMLVIDSHAHPPRKGVPGIDNRPRTIPKSLEQIDKIFGSKGAIVADESSMYEIPPYSVKVIDNIGAGDAFAAGFLCGILEERDLFTCGKMGAMMGAQAVGTLGDIEGLPDRKRLELLLNGNKENYR